MSEDIMETAELTRRAEVLYAFLDVHSTYRSIPRDYGTGEIFRISEIHLLDYIDQNPGTTVTDIAIGYRKSKSYISQLTSAYEKAGYLVRMSDPQDAKKQRFFLSKEGKRINEAHLRYDEIHRIEAYRYLRGSCTREEIDAFYKVLAVFTEHMSQVNKKALEEAHAAASTPAL